MDGKCLMSGTPLFWPKACLSTSVQVDGSKKLGITADDVEAIVRKAFDNWENVACPQGGKPNIHVETFPQVQCDEKRYNYNARNQNLWVFRDDVWPNKDPINTLALTTVRFKEDGTIVDADVEFNSANATFSLETVAGATDLQTIIQHESGHFLGLAHSNDQMATMWEKYLGADMRTLEADDAEGICAVFPPTNSPDEGCDPTPNHGFSTLCDEPIGDDGCSLNSPASRSAKRRDTWVLVAIGFLAAGLRRKRKARVQ
jgi:MYXO-CTERM domain-containing protein